MTTAGARLVAISGAGSTAAERMRFASGSTAFATAGQLLVLRSGLPSSTAAVHLMYDPTIAAGRAAFVGMHVNTGSLMLRS